MQDESHVQRILSTENIYLAKYRTVLATHFLKPTLFYSICKLIFDS